MNIIGIINYPRFLRGVPYSLRGSAVCIERALCKHIFEGPAWTPWSRAKAAEKSRAPVAQQLSKIAAAGNRQKAIRNPPK